MADDKSKRGKPDSDLVSKQPWEIQHLADKFELPKPLIENIVEQVGPGRTAIEQKLQEMKENGKRK